MTRVIIQLEIVVVVAYGIMVLSVPDLANTLSAWAAILGGLGWAALVILNWRQL